MLTMKFSHTSKLNNVFGCKLLDHSLLFLLVCISLLLPVAFTSCIDKQGKEHQDIEVITVPDFRSETTNTRDAIPISTFVDSVGIIPLELNDSCMLNQLQKIVIDGNELFISDGGREQQVYRFDTSGNFLNIIGRPGQGPEDVGGFGNFSIDKINKIVYIHDRMTKSVKKYDYEGRFISSLKVNYHFTAMEYMNGRIYLYDDHPRDLDFCFIVKDAETGNTISSFFPSAKHHVGSSGNFFCKIDEDLYFHPNFIDSVYMVNGNNLTCAYYVDFGKMKISEEDVQDYYTGKSNFLFDVLLNRNTVPGISDFSKVGKWIYFTTSIKKVHQMFLYNTENSSVMPILWIWDDINYLLSTANSFGFCGQTESALIGSYNTEGMEEITRTYDLCVSHKLMTKAQRDSLVLKMKGYMKDEKAEDLNPWVMLYYLKK